MYDFDRIIDRRNTSSVKWDLADDLFHGKNLIPMWVADMDFLSPPVVIEALCERARHGIFGYTAATDNYYEAVIGWMKKRHGWDIHREWIHFSPGVVPALSLILQTFTRPGDEVIIQPPVYYPFMRVVKNSGCHIVNNPLRCENGRYYMDFEDLERKTARGRVRAVILCSPHNPVGRVWTVDELRSFREICDKRNILMISDEIHGDLMLPGNVFVPLDSLDNEAAQNVITCTSPSKTFNLAGLQTSNIIIPSGAFSGQYRITLERNGIQGPSSFGAVACEAAYNGGDGWLLELLAYLAKNLDFLHEFLAERIPRVRITEPGGTYLVWLDFRAILPDPDELMTVLVRDAKIALDPGTLFGKEGAGFMRINIGCPRSTLATALERIAAALESYM